jgi:hypothetical protein
MFFPGFNITCFTFYVYIFVTYLLALPRIYIRTSFIEKENIHTQRNYESCDIDDVSRVPRTHYLQFG